jgi:hypothetical protein
MKREVTMTKEIPAGTYCDECEWKPADEERNLATTYDDHYGYAPTTYYCEDCYNAMCNAYEPPTESYGGTVVMDEHGRIY